MSFFAIKFSWTYFANRLILICGAINESLKTVNQNAVVWEEIYQRVMMSSIEEYILNIPKFAGKTSLDNTKYLLNKLDISEEELKIIHVAGTNGKGSVCSYISNVLVKAG